MIRKTKQPTNQPVRPVSAIRHYRQRIVISKVLTLQDKTDQ